MHNGNGLRRRYVIARAEFWQRFCLKTPDQSKNKTITLPMHDRTVTFKGLPYLFDFVLPNVYFHVATAYVILRHKSVEIGKKDFLGKIY
jgi:hypothetical protein